jgi:ribosomal protein L11 methyltransferase
MVRPYLAYTFTISPLEPTREILVAELAQLGFESFEETATGLLAYIPEDEAPENISELYVVQQAKNSIRYTTETIAPKNWNAQWEADFKPVHVGDRCVIRAPFHPEPSCDYDVVIQPKMSFGTGHHETTELMVQLLLDTDCSGKKVLDMGTGTGVLAILAEKMGAASVAAFDIDSWSYENSKENCTLNHCTKVEVHLGDTTAVTATDFDIIIANINRNVLLQQLPDYAKRLRPSGVLLLSGFYLNDLQVLKEKATFNGLKWEHHIVKNDWTAAIFRA